MRIGTGVLVLQVFTLAACGPETKLILPSDQSCLPQTRVCSEDDVLICRASGTGYDWLKSCDWGCSAGNCVDETGDAAVDAVEQDDTSVEDSESGSSGCLLCPCMAGESCNDGLVCFAGICISPGCQSDSDCPQGQRCYVAGCIPEGCGNGQTEAGEECDDGNNLNNDGCNVNCDKEAGSILAGGVPIGFASDPGAISVAMGVCSDKETAAKYLPGDMIPVRVCAVTYLDINGQGLSAAQAKSDIEQAQKFYEAAGSKIVLQVVHSDSIQGTPDQTDPDSSAEIDALLNGLRTIENGKYPGQCQVIVGYVHSMKADYGTVGGMGTWPSTGIHTCAVTRFNVETVPGQTAAHEIGHVLGLLHTHEDSTADNDGCEDTAPDSGCYDGPPTCSKLCPDGSQPPAENVMSYYFCDTPSEKSFSSCQINRSRCFIDKMFPKDSCKLPVLNSPEDGASVGLGKSVTFKWKPANETSDQYLMVRRDPPTGPLVWNEPVGTAASKTLTTTAFGPGQYAWSVAYYDTCCPDGQCESVSRSLLVSEVQCSGPATQPCGFCGSQTRTCKPDGTWTAWSECAGAGQCDPGDSKSCTSGQAVICTDSCIWPLCPTCTPDCNEKCPGQDNGCGGVCQSNMCSGCCYDKACNSVSVYSYYCGSNGAACNICSADATCDWGTCSGCSQDFGEPAACSLNDTTGCAQAVGTFASEKDQWVEVAGATAFPDYDYDYFQLTLTDTEFFATLDPTVELDNTTDIDLKVCVYWRNANSSQAELNGGCTSGQVASLGEAGWENSAGCCRTVAAGQVGQNLSFQVTDAPGDALVEVSSSDWLGSCAVYNLRMRL